MAHKKSQPSNEDSTEVKGPVILGGIRVTTPVPTKIQGITVYGNVEAQGSGNIDFKELQVMKGNNLMAGNLRVKNVIEANITENRIAGDVHVDTVEVLSLVRNRIGIRRQDIVDQLVLLCREPGTLERLQALETRVDDLEEVVNLAEEASRGLRAEILRRLREAAISLGINQATEAAKLGISKLWTLL